MGTTIRWLHFTDLHVGMDDQDWLWPQMQLKFRDDLKKIYDVAGPWDLVLFTGDLVQKGSEYSKLNKVLDEIWGCFADLGCDPKLLTVPGNHDLQWRDPKDPVVKQLYRWEQEAEVRDDFWEPSGKRYRPTVKNAFAVYDDWWRDSSRKPAGVEHGFLPGDFSCTFEKDGFRLGIVGLNTAFLQLTEKRGRGKFKGHLAVHPHQFHRACDGNGVQWAESHHACILMTHHPPDWLNKESREHFEDQVIENFQLHLCGHNHETEVLQELPGGVEFVQVRWLGRSLFGLEKSSAGRLDRSHGYVAGELRLSDDFRGELQFMPRERRKQGKKSSIVPDHDMKLPDDRRTHAFPIRVQPVPIDVPMATGDGGNSVTDLNASGTVIPEDLLPKVVSYLRDLPEACPALYEELAGAVQQEMPPTKTGNDASSPPSLIDVVLQEGVNDVLSALYRWLDHPGGRRIDADGWRDALTHLVVLGAASPDWLNAAREQHEHGGLVTVGSKLDPLFGAVLVSGMFDIAIRLDGALPAGHIPIGRGRGSKGHQTEDRYDALKSFLQKKYSKFFPVESEPLDGRGIKEMLLTDRELNNPRFVCLPEGDPLAHEIGQRLGGLVTVLQENEAAPRVLDQSLRLVRTIQELLDKLQPSS